MTSVFVILLNRSCGKSSNGMWEISMWFNPDIAVVAPLVRLHREVRLHLFVWKQVYKIQELYPQFTLYSFCCG